MHRDTIPIHKGNGTIGCGMPSRITCNHNIKYNIYNIYSKYNIYNIYTYIHHICVTFRRSFIRTSYPRVYILGSMRHLCRGQPKILTQGYYSRVDSAVNQRGTSSQSAGNIHRTNTRKKGETDCEGKYPTRYQVYSTRHHLRDSYFGGQAQVLILM